mmetsp:Transcript_35730/g.77085  ORF Transcript_35730/g.77085 Transcript_35730/m.77085 type:complete len:92 (-) Transcript_35730:169-444(-)
MVGRYDRERERDLKNDGLLTHMMCVVFSDTESGAGIYLWSWRETNNVSRFDRDNEIHDGHNIKNFETEFYILVEPHTCDGKSAPPPLEMIV